jgi:hypothetical protein
MTGQDRPEPDGAASPGSMPVPDWPGVARALQDAATLDLDAGAAPLPTLFAFIGDEPQAMVTLRPVGPEELLQAFIEILALFLPLGVDRVAYSLATRCGDFAADVRHLLVVRTDAHDGGCETRVEVVPGVLRGGAWRWGPPADAETGADGGLVTAIAFLLEHRTELEPADEAGPRVAAQFGRVLLLGHELALSPDLARRLTAVTTR